MHVLIKKHPGLLAILFPIYNSIDVLLLAVN